MPKHWNRREGFGGNASAAVGATYGPRHFDLIVLENGRGDTIGDRVVYSTT